MWSGGHARAHLLAVSSHPFVLGLYATEDIHGFPVPNDPWVVLFHCSSEPAGRYKNSIAPHLLNAAKTLIPKYWKEPTISTNQPWFHVVDHIYYMEDLPYDLRNLCHVSKKNCA